MSELSPSEADRLNQAVDALPADVRELLRRRDAESRETLLRSARVAIMIRNFSHGVGSHLAVKPQSH